MQEADNKNTGEREKIKGRGGGVLDVVVPDIICAALFTPTVTRKAGQNILTVYVCLCIFTFTSHTYAL